MTLEDIKALPVFQTESIGEAAKDTETHGYILKCLSRLYAGDYGNIAPDVTAANNEELLAGAGKLLTRYGKSEKLTGDIYIIAAFDNKDPENVDANNIMIMYREDY